MTASSLTSASELTLLLWPWPPLLSHKKTQGPRENQVTAQPHQPVKPYLAGEAMEYWGAPKGPKSICRLTRLQNREHTTKTKNELRFPGTAHLLHSQLEAAAAAAAVTLTAPRPNVTAPNMAPPDSSTPIADPSPAAGAPPRYLHREVPAPCTSLLSRRRRRRRRGAQAGCGNGTDEAHARSGRALGL